MTSKRVKKSDNKEFVSVVVSLVEAFIPKSEFFRYTRNSILQLYSQLHNALSFASCIMQPRAHSSVPDLMALIDYKSCDMH